MCVCLVSRDAANINAELVYLVMYLWNLLLCLVAHAYTCIIIVDCMNYCHSDCLYLVGKANCIVFTIFDEGM